MGDAEGAKSVPPLETKALNGGDKAADEDDLPEAVPLGKAIKEEDGRKFYSRFEYDGTEFKSLDTVSLNPDEGTPDIPYFALIKVRYSDSLHTTFFSTLDYFHKSLAKQQYVSPQGDDAFLRVAHTFPKALTHAPAPHLCVADNQLLCL